MTDPHGRINPQAGLTLLEVLIVLSIIAVMASAVVMGASASRDRSAQAEAHRLAVKLRTAADDALLSQRTYRFVWTEDSYRFELPDNNGVYRAVATEQLAEVSNLSARLHLESDLPRNFINIRPDGLGDDARFVLSARADGWAVRFDGLKADVSLWNR